MAETKKIKTALVSVFHKDGLDQILAELPGIASMKLKSEGKGRTSVQLRTDQEDIYGLSRSIFFAFAARNRALLEMSLKKANLEEIFLELTQK